MFNLFAPINPTGYGVHATNLIGGLTKLTKEFTLFPIGQVQYEGKHQEAINHAIARGNAMYRSDVPSVCLWHAHDMARFSGTPRIAYPVFELDKLSRQESIHLGSVNDIIVTSQWAVNVILNDVPHSTIGPRDKSEEIQVHVVPEGVDTEIYTYDEDRECDTKSGVTMLNVGKFEQRKGHIHILDMMSRIDMECDLIAVWSNFFLRPEVIDNTIIAHGFGAPKMTYLDREELDPKIMCKLFTHRNGNRIWLVPSNHSDPMFIRKLIDYADVGVFPYAAEGWNLPLIECMASGLPCIATDYSGPTEYLTPENHIPLQNQGLIPASDGMFFRSGIGRWASVSVDELIEKIHGINDGQLTQINAALKGFGEKWKWQNSAGKLLRTITMAQALML